MVYRKRKTHEPIHVRDDFLAQAKISYDRSTCVEVTGMNTVGQRWTRIHSLSETVWFIMLVVRPIHAHTHGTSTWLFSYDRITKSSTPLKTTNTFSQRLQRTSCFSFFILFYFPLFGRWRLRCDDNIYAFFTWNMSKWVYCMWVSETVLTCCRCANSITCSLTPMHVNESKRRCTHTLTAHTMN